MPAWRSPTGCLWVRLRLVPSDIGRSNRIDVALEDNATGGCWTNLAEVRQYARDRLRSKGYTVRSDAEDRLHITVHSERTTGGLCYGNIRLQTYTAAPFKSADGRR